jgi:hypothetical protein
MPRPGQPTSYQGIFESTDEVNTVTISYDTPVPGNMPVMRFPSAGRVVGAWISSQYSSSGTNVLLVGLKNGGNTLGGIGTVVTAPTNNGTVLAGSVYQLVVALDGKEQFAAGDWIVLNVANVMTPNAGFTLSLDYNLD